MTNQKKWWLAFWSGAILVVSITGWALFAPPQLGGQATMVIVDGNSMEPVYHQGDLVIVRTADYYQTGDIVAYENLQMGRYVIHRIIGEELNRFELQGDNNTWTDGFKPTSDEIIGKQWIRIPKIGKVINWLRKPIYLSLTVCLLGGVFMITWLKEKNSKWHRKTKANFNIYNWISTDQLGKSGETYFLILGIGLVIAIIAGGIAFAKPIEKNIPKDVFYTHQGEFSYSAPAPEGVYDSSTIESGAPVFLKLTCEIKIDYQYTLVGQSLHGVNGTQSMTAVISDTTGWKRTIPLESQTRFEGNSAQTTSILNVCQAAEMVDLLREKTGLQRSEFSLAIIPSTKVTGLVEGLALADEYSPSLNFRINEVGFWMVSNDSGSEDTDPLNTSSEGMLRTWVEEPETMAFLGFSFPVNGVRWGSSLLFILSSGLLAFLMYTTDKISKNSQSSGIQLKYSPMLVNVHKQPPILRRGEVEVKNFEGLVRIAERNNAVILHEIDSEGIHNYLVESENTVYRMKIEEKCIKLVNLHLLSKKTEITEALRKEEFELYYQPMVDLYHQHITGVEALLRWNHPTHGTLLPSSFMADAEATDLIHLLDEWVLTTACSQLQQWTEAGTQPVIMAINVSSKQLLPGLPKLIKRLIRENKLQPNNLQFEFSESQLLEDLDNNILILDEIRKIGVEISIDNYTGKASMAHLARIQAKNIKFALAMLSKLNDPQMEAITLSTIAAARSLGMAIDVVGVETEEQLWFLRSHLVSSVQGYLFGKPVSADETLQKLFGNEDKVTVLQTPTMEK